MADYSSKYLFEARASGIDKTANQINKLADALDRLVASASRAGGANLGGLGFGVGTGGAGTSGAASSGGGGGTGGIGGGGGGGVFYGGGFQFPQQLPAPASRPYYSSGQGGQSSFPLLSAPGAGSSSVPGADGIIDVEGKEIKRPPGQDWFPTAAQIGRALAYSAVIATAYTAMGLVTDATNEWIDAQTEYNRVLVDTEVTLGGTTQEIANFADRVRYLSYLSGEAFSESSIVARREQILNRPGMGASAAGLNVVFPTLDLSTTAEDITAIQTQFDASFGDINDVLLALIQTSGVTADELLSMSETWGALTDDLQLGGRNLSTMREIGALMSSMSVIMGESGTVIEQFLRKLGRIYTDPEIATALEQIGISVTDVNGQFRSMIDILDEISAKGLGDEAYNVLEGFFPNDLGQKTKQQLREFTRNIELITGVVSAAKDSTASYTDALITANQSLDVVRERMGAAFSNWLSSIGDITNATVFLSGVAAALQNSATRKGPGGFGYEGYVGLTNALGPGTQGLRTSPEQQQVIDAIATLTGGGANDSVPFQAEVEARKFVEALPAEFFGAIQDSQSRREYLDVAIGRFRDSKYFSGSGDIETTIQEFLLFMGQAGEGVNLLYEALSTGSAATQSNADAILSNTSAVDDATDAVSVFAGAAYDAASRLSSRERIFIEGKRIGAGGSLAWYQATNPGALQFPNYPPWEKIKADEKRADAERQLAERLARQQQSDWDRLMNNMASAWDSMLDSITKPTSVTASDVGLTKAGLYKDKFDEPLREFRADINHLINKEPEQYGSTSRFADYINQDALAAAMGADIDTRTAILRGIEDDVATKYNALQMPAEFYNKDALIASANDYIAGKQQSKETRATMEGWLTDAGIDKSFAEQFLNSQEQSPLINAITGGASAEDINNQLGDYMPDIAGSLSDQFLEVDWAGMIENSAKTNIDNNRDKLVGVGVMLAGPITEGAGDAFVANIVPEIIKAVASYYE